MDLTAIQKALRERNIDAWLFYDHHHRDPIAYRVLGLADGLMVTRRWFYLIPAKGEPTKLVHKIEAGHLETLPGTKRLYSGWQELFDSMKGLLASHRDIAMQYSPNNLVFTISLVDAGTVDLIRGLGKNVVSSQDLVAQFEATMNDEQIATHFAARDMVVSVPHPGLDHETKVAGVAIKMSETPGRVRHRAPLLGEHTDQYLSSLGLGGAEIARLRAEKIVA